jgi:histidine ammonia-lyase
MTHAIDGKSLSIRRLHALAHNYDEPVELTREAHRAVARSRAVIESWLREDATIYGVTTGFGELSNVRIDLKDIGQLQKNLIYSHAVGAGDPMPDEIVRAMMVLRINTLAKGYSGIRPETLAVLTGMFNAGIVPVIPSQGSVGASGDLVQLAHLVLTMMGKGLVKYKGKTVDAGKALRAANLKPVGLTAKEGLALINGTQMMTAYTALAVHEAAELSKLIDIAASVTLEALKGTPRAFDARLHRLRPLRGQSRCAANMRRLLKRSEIRRSHLHGDPRVQDAYSIRCIPQVHGASRDAIDFVYDTLTIELNSANDNPLICPKDGVHIEGGNFHGQPIALAADFLGIALSEFASISERRIERLVNGSLSGLPRFLTTREGLNSGMMIAQYTAASLVSENKVLAHPASVDSIPTSANQEDHNSMGSISAQKAYRILKNVQTVVALEFLTACQGMDFSRIHPKRKHIMKAGVGAQAAYDFIRGRIDYLGDDRVLYNDVQTILSLIRDGSLLRHVEKQTGKLK